jgi:hypothetical protein
LSGVPRAVFSPARVARGERLSLRAIAIARPKLPGS